MPDVSEHPHDERCLLRVHEVGVREVAEVLAVVARRVVPTAVHVAPLTVADPRRGTIGAVPDSRAALTLDVVDDVGHELVAVRIVDDRESLALAGASAGPPRNGVAARFTQVRDVD
jgi:hypothetical protein